MKVKINLRLKESNIDPIKSIISRIGVYNFQYYIFLSQRNWRK
jgi:hypothetical protein